MILKAFDMFRIQVAVSLINIIRLASAIQVARHCAGSANIVYCIDTSDSIKSENNVENAVQFTSTFLRYIERQNRSSAEKGGKLDLGILTFGKGSTIRHRELGSGENLNDTISRLAAKIPALIVGTTSTLFAIQEAEQMLGAKPIKEQGNVGAIVIFSDGEPTPPTGWSNVGVTNQMFIDFTLDEAERAKNRYVIYTVHVSTYDDNGRAIMAQIATDNVTAHSFENLNDERAYKKAFSLIMKDICANSIAHVKSETVHKIRIIHEQESEEMKKKNASHSEVVNNTKYAILHPATVMPSRKPQLPLCRPCDTPSLGGVWLTVSGVIGTGMAFGMGFSAAVFTRFLM